MPKLSSEAETGPVDLSAGAEVRRSMEQYGGEDAVFEQLGLGVDELAQTVTFGTHTGTLWEALKPSLVPEEERPKDMPPCPLGDRIKQVYQANGDFGEVVKIFEGAKMMDPRFSVLVSERTVARHATRSLQNETPTNRIDPEKLTDSIDKARNVKSPKLHLIERKIESKSVRSSGIQEVTAAINDRYRQQQQLMQSQKEILKAKPSETPGMPKNRSPNHETAKVHKLPKKPTVKSQSVGMPVKPKRVKQRIVAPEAPLIEQPIRLEKAIIKPEPGISSWLAVFPETEAKSLDAESKLYELPETRPVLLEAETEQFPPELGLVPDEAENDGWIEAIMLGYQLEAQHEVKPNEATLLPRIILTEIAEMIDMPEQLVTQTEALLVALPETVKSQLDQHIREAEPEVAVAAEELLIKLAPLADRLHELAIDDQLESEESLQIQEEVVALYRELLTQLKIEVDDQVIADFIAVICSRTYGVQQPRATDTLFDQSLLERTATHKKRKLDLTAAAKRFALAAQTMELEIARLMVRRSTSLATMSRVPLYFSR